MPIILLLALAQMTPPDEPLVSRLRAAIWDDLRANGMIGNGNRVASRWMNFWGGDDVPLHIVDLVCRGNALSQTCRFDMLRDGGTIVVDGESVPDRIRCRATIRRPSEREREWSIAHLPPRPGGGHSRTTMRCEWAAAADAR